MHGYQGRILKVDLRTGKDRVIDLPGGWLHDYVGGEGLGMRLYWDYLDPARDLCDPAEPLIFAPALTGPASQPDGAATLVFRSPGGGGMASEPCCPAFAAELGRTGLEALVIVGRSRRPALLHITGESAAMLDVTDLWGTPADLAESAVRELLGDDEVSVTCAGPLGRDGAAEDMGPAARALAAKNLKAVAVRGRRDGGTAAAAAGRPTAAGRTLTAKRTGALRRLIDARLAGGEPPLDASELLALGLEWTAAKRRKPVGVH